MVKTNYLAPNRIHTSAVLLLDKNLIRFSSFSLWLLSLALTCSLASMFKFILVFIFLDTALQYFAQMCRFEDALEGHF